MIEYATTGDLADWVSPSVTIPEDAAQLLRSASVIIARAVNESLYDPAIVTTDARRDATCAQVVSWLTSGVRPGTGGLELEPVLKAKAIGTAKFEYDTNRTASAEALAKREQIAEDLCPEAEAILRSAGLLWVPVPLFMAGRADCGALLAEWPYCNPLDWWRS